VSFLVLLLFFGLRCPTIVDVRFLMAVVLIDWTFDFLCK